MFFLDKKPTKHHSEVYIPTKATETETSKESSTMNKYLLAIKLKINVLLNLYISDHNNYSVLCEYRKRRREINLNIICIFSKLAQFINEAN